MTKPTAPSSNEIDFKTESLAETFYSQEDNFITKQDKSHGFPQIYDAFVLYDENDDDHMHAIVEIVKHLESKNFSVRKNFMFTFITR